MVTNLISLFERDLNRLAKEIQSYNRATDLWLLPKGINNTGGNLCLHLVGNLQHFIGKVLGNTGFVRNRKAEFEAKNVPVSTLIREIETTISVITKTLNKLNETQLNTVYPIDVLGKPMTTSFFLMHLYGHLNYHLGQINYHRRLVVNLS